jgi:hypothetical protein
MDFGVSGLVVKSIVAIDGPRVRFAADASFRIIFDTDHETEMLIDACYLYYLLFKPLSSSPKTYSTNLSAHLRLLLVLQALQDHAHPTPAPNIDYPATHS